MFNATITGRLGSDPEMRYTDGGTPVVNVPVAHNGSTETRDWLSGSDALSGES